MSKKYRKIKELFIPKNLDLGELLKAYPVSFAGFKADQVHFVCDGIYRGSLELDESTFIHPQKKEKYFVPLHTTTLHHYLGHNYRKVTDWMCTSGIIERDNSYEKDVVSTGHRFTEHYRNSGFQKVAVTDFVMYKKKPSKKIIALQHRPTTRATNGLKKWCAGLTIDKEPAKAAIATKYVNSILKKGCKWDEIEMQYKNNSILIDAYEAPQDIFSCDNFSGRLHTILSRTPKYLRSYVTYNGEELAQTDICNSQLFHMLYLFQSDNWKKNRQNKGDVIWSGLEAVNSFEETSNLIKSSKLYSIMFYNNPELQCGSDFRDTRFLQLATSGKIYNYLAEMLTDGEDFFSPRLNSNQKREVVKKLLTSQLNGDLDSLNTDESNAFNLKGVDATEASKDRRRQQRKLKHHKSLYTGKNAMLWGLFTELFPIATSITKQIKKYRNNALAKLLQRIEKVSVIDIACAAIAHELPKVPIFTIHDCIVTTKANIYEVDRIFKSAVANFIGCAPQTEIKMWRDYPTIKPFEDD